MQGEHAMQKRRKKIHGSDNARSTSLRFKEEEYTFLQEQCEKGCRPLSDQVRLIIREWRADRGL
jgi:hypothetical protein